MSTHLLDAGKAAWTSEANPQQTYSDRPTLALDGTGADEKRAYLWFPNPVGRLGDSVLSAALTVYLANEWAGSTTVTVERITQSWKQNAIKFGSAGNTPSVTSTNAATATVTSGSAGTRVEVDVSAILADVSAGASWYGVRITVDAAGPLRLHSPTSPTHAYRPTLLVDMSVDPDAPDELKPNGDTYATDDAAPLLRWAFNSSDSNAYQEESQVQITDTEGSYSTTVYDSDWRTNDEAQWDVDADDEVAAELADNTQFWWRVRVRDQNGQTTGWSDEATFLHASSGDLQIVDPELDDDDVADTTPTITWYTGGRDQRQIRIRVYDGTGNALGDLLYERPWASQEQDDDTTGWGSTAANPLPVGYDSFTIPSTVPNRKGNGDPIIATPNAKYAVEVAMRDRYARRDDEVVTDTRYFDFVPTSDAAPPTLTATATGGVPYVTLEWTRASEPDAWVLLRDGVVIQELDGDVPFVSGTTYSAIDYTARPGVTYTYSVRSKTTGSGLSAAVTATDMATAPVGVWIMDPDNDVVVPLLGQNSIDQELQETATLLEPLNRRDPVRIVGRIGGYSGVASGTIAEWNGSTAASLLASLEDLVGQRSTDDLRLVFGVRNLLVNIGNLKVSQHPGQSGTEQMHDVSFTYWQVGGYTVDV